MALDILKKMEHLQTTVSNHVELREGFIHLGGGATAVSGIFPDAISEFKKKYPKIQFTLLENTSAAIIEALHDGIVDIGLTIKDSFTATDENLLEGLHIHLEISDSFEIIASPDHPLAIMSRSLESAGKSLLPMHLNRQSFIALESGTITTDLIDYEFRRLGIRYRPLMTLRSTANMIKMVQKNIGLSVVSKHTIKDEKNIQILKTQNLNITRSILVCSVKDRKMSPAAEAFVDILKSLYKG
jgi:DNA-binding transcriptional LysR family regulator